MLTKLKTNVVTRSFLLLSKLKQIIDEVIILLTYFAKQTFSSLETGERSFRSKYINTFSSFFIHSSLMSRNKKLLVT